MVDGGLTGQGLMRLHEVLAGHVEQGTAPGLVALLARGTTVHVEVMGSLAFGDGRPMPRDAIFRIASLTKPVTAAAAMILVDEGVLELDGPVDGWLPELAGRRVLRSIEAELDDTVEAARAITVEDLLTFRLGFGNVMHEGRPYPVEVAEAALDLKTLSPPWPPRDYGPDEWLRRFATLPLMFQPGERWLYNTGALVLGILVERAAGQPLAAFLAQRLFEPLGMVDTGFSFSPDQADRMTAAYASDPETGGLLVLDEAADGFWSRPPPLPDGAGWLVSTVDDYWRFVQMILAGGAHGHRRLLSDRAVRLMTTNHLTPAQSGDNSLFLGPGGGWGFGMRVPAGQGRPSHLPGGFGWDGGTGTTWRSDPACGLTGILLTQRAMDSPAPPPVFVDFWAAAYAALDG
jgi:CubicO group peptidase (beta-lactamase class C family)